ncbi:hypothetical protein JMJ58_03615 [Haloterrigena salifodinae]|uniref:Uncharacterized protein n=1 Tax=Haloterrigena salifodinae TaxID=2675099 RepID=A0A8T8E388_9EURY|nr:hypothetical protein [Haloterrigena salifodinae]QRV15996.1 hypothetical protein JMJ58_03615 [Haloterrigena salifodinae]
MEYEPYPPDIDGKELLELNGSPISAPKSDAETIVDIPMSIWSWRDVIDSLEYRIEHDDEVNGELEEMLIEQIESAIDYQTEEDC